MQDNQIIFVCIGSNKITGDCLGPLVGTYLKQNLKNEKNIRIYGDMYSPINYTNINDIKNEVDTIIKNKENNGNNYIIILIDSALGKNVGEIIIDTGKVELGSALYKEETIYSDINIKGIVGENYNNRSKNMHELINVPEKIINSMCKDILNIINRKIWQNV